MFGLSSGLFPSWFQDGCQQQLQLLFTFSRKETLASHWSLLRPRKKFPRSLHRPSACVLWAEMQSCSFLSQALVGLHFWVLLWDQIPSVTNAAWGRGRDLNKTEVLLGRTKGRIDSGKTTNNSHLCVLCSKKLPCSFFSFLCRSLHCVIEIMLDPVLTVERDNLWPTLSKSQNTVVFLD